MVRCHYAFVKAFCKICSFCKRIFSHSWEILESERASFLRHESLSSCFEEGILYPFKIFED